MTARQKERHWKLKALLIRTLRSNYKYPLFPGGFNANQLRDHLESIWLPGMTWANRGNRRGQWCTRFVKHISEFPEMAKDSEIMALSNIGVCWVSEPVVLPTSVLRPMPGTTTTNI